jgi:prepilin-type N-terminal cleavage/methylation domain-containing protein
MIKKTMASPKHDRGFTLVELTIVLIIVALMVGGLTVSLTAQIDLRESEATNRQLDQISETIVGFAIANGRLPCPADPALAETAAGAGLEDITAPNCNRARGTLPWVTLGLPQLDTWGRRFTYAATQKFSDLTDGADTPVTCVTVTLGASFALCSEGNITLRNASGGSILTDNLPAIVVSHGKNGRGAFLQDGTQIAAGGSDEAENADADQTFVSHTPTPAGANEFDDRLIWISPHILKSKMLAAGRLP